MGLDAFAQFAGQKVPVGQNRRQAPLVIGQKYTDKKLAGLILSNANPGDVDESIRIVSPDFGQGAIDVVPIQQDQIAVGLG